MHAYYSGLMLLGLLAAACAGPEATSAKQEARPIFRRSQAPRCSEVVVHVNEEREWYVGFASIPGNLWLYLCRADAASFDLATRGRVVAEVSELVKKHGPFLVHACINESALAESSSKMRAELFVSLDRALGRGKVRALSCSFGYVHPD